MPNAKQIIETQAIEKSALIVAGTTLISTGVATLSNDKIVGLALISLGVFCLITREVIKVINK